MNKPFSLKMTLGLLKGTLLALTISAALTACEKPDKKAELAEMKKQHAELKIKIDALEKELGPADEKIDEEAIKVTVAEIKNEAFHHYIDVQGVLESDENITVLAQSAGTITQIFVKEGQAVKKDQNIAEIDNSIIRKSIDEVKVQLDFANTMFQKQKKLWEQNIGTEVQYLSAKNNKEALENRMATLKEQLDLTFIKSPIAGSVDLLPVKKGQMVAPGIPAVRIVNFANLKVKANLAEKYAPLVKKGSAVIAEFPDMKTQVQTQVSHVSRVIDPMTRSFIAEAVLPSGSGDYFPNMVAVMKIKDYTNDNAIVIPISTVMKSLKENFVFVAVNENGGIRAHKKTVQLGHTYNGKVEIISGLQPGEKIVVAGQQNLKEGDPVLY